MLRLGAGREVEDGDDLPGVVVDVELWLGGPTGRHGVDRGADRDCYDMRVEVGAELACCLEPGEQMLKGADGKWKIVSVYWSSKGTPK